MDDLMKWVSLVSGFFTIAASGLAIFIYFSKREEIFSVFQLLINYSYQLSLSELKEKLEKINDLHPDDIAQRIKIQGLFHEIIGQIHGNEKLKPVLVDAVDMMEKFGSAPKFSSDSYKRRTVSMLKEQLRTINVGNINSMAVKK